MYVYCVYPAISKSQKQLPTFLQLAETSVFIIVSVESYVTSELILLPFFFLLLYMNQIPEMLY